MSYMGFNKFSYMVSTRFHIWQGEAQTGLMNEVMTSNALATRDFSEDELRYFQNPCFL